MPGVVPREAAGGDFHVEDTVQSALLVYPLLEGYYFAGRSPDDKQIKYIYREITHLHFPKKLLFSM